MPRYAVAVLYRDFPKYDRVDCVKDTIFYYDGDVMVGQAHYHPNVMVAYPEHLMLDIVKACTEKDALQKVKDKWSYHILRMSVLEIKEVEG